MDTLADLASMQNHQPVNTTPPLNSRNSAESISSLRRPSLTSRPRASFDIAMVETPRQLLRGDYTGTSLSLERQQRLAELVGHIQETPPSYEAHIEVIKILHQGFVDHIYPSSSPNARRDPRSYDLLTELRQARENADKVFALGEEQWLGWLQDESILAQSAEDRVGVVEKCRRAVQEEHGSTQLWSTYGDWMMHCYRWAQDPNAVFADGPPDEERLVGRELFPFENVLRVWEEAVEQTQYDIAQSHIVWKEALLAQSPDFEEKMADKAARRVLELFQRRLSMPHAEWDSTFQYFSSFVSANFTNEAYEQIMAGTNQAAAPIKSIWATREPFETAISEARESGDKYTEYQAFVAYIQWEKEDCERSRRQKRGKRREQFKGAPQGLLMVNALFQRAELRIPNVVDIWEAHVDFLIENRLAELPSVLSRATKHCPWSGSLWKQYLLASEIAEHTFQNIENIKHDATKTGMLDAGGVEEVLKVYDAWCGYLVRRSRRVDSVEEDADVAEMGIRTSMEAIQSLASKLELPANFDVSFRLQRKYVEYLKAQGRLDNARKQFDDNITVYGNYYRFWLRFYEFEMQKSLHITSLQQDSRDGVSLNSSAPFAVAVLKQGLERVELDYPEYLIEALINHCEDYEDAEELQSAVLLVNKIQKQMTSRRQNKVEGLAVQVESPAAAVAEQRAEEVANNLHIGGKRKRGDEEERDAPKKSRVETPPINSVEVHPDTSGEPKRDRENASILVQHVPSNVSETRVRQYFTACGTIKSIKRPQDQDFSFSIEFTSAEEAEYALSRDGQDLDGAAISVTLKTKSTLYVTNYPASADEDYIRSLFNPYGEISSIRLPSLQANKRRRFCYVEFKSADQAHAALELDGQERDGLSLMVKISNPSAKKQRDEYQSDGRTIFIGQIPFTASEDQLLSTFSSYGKIQGCRMPRDHKTKSRNRGIAFLTFVEKEAAHAALEMEGKSFEGRKIKVYIADSQSSLQNTAVQGGRSKSPSASVNSDAASPASFGLSTDEFEERRQRTVALSGVPDTINEARIRALAERVGPVRKVILKTNHQGALIEFETVPAAGKAAIELDGFEISQERRIAVTSQKDMLSQKPEKKVEAIGKALKSFPGLPPKRPTQVPRKGGHLGQRSAVVFKQPNGEGASNVGERKTNDDFRAMLNRS